MDAEAAPGLPCPRCGATLVHESVPSHYGSRIEIERCGVCGGVFTTWGRILALSPEAVAEWDERNTREIAAGSDLALRTIACPICHLELAPVTGADLPTSLKVPHDLHLHLCSRGDGFWIEPEALRTFKLAQSQNLEAKRSAYAQELEARRSRTRATAAALGYSQQPSVKRAYSSAIVFLLFLMLSAVVGTLFLRFYSR